MQPKNPDTRKNAPTKPKPHAGPSSDKTLASITPHTTLPRSLHPHSPPPPTSRNTGTSKTASCAAHAARSKTLIEGAEMLLDEIVKGAGMEGAKGRQEWRLDGGPYRSRYSRNGRHLAVFGSTGHVATFDWQTGTIHAELQLQETCRDIAFLQDQSFCAVAQKKFIYDRNGVELHRLKSHIEPTRLEFLPYHWLLATVVRKPWYLRYQDMYTGAIVAEHRTKAGACRTVTQNRHNAIIHLGHQNGVVSLWTPNLPHPAVQLLAHLGPVVSLSVDPSTGGRYMASSGADGRQGLGAVREWTTRGGDAELEWSAKGALAVATGGSVNHYPVLLLLICATVWVYALFLFLELGGVAIVTLRGSVGAQRDHITFIPDTGIDTNAVCCHFQGCSAALPHTCDSPPASDIFVVGHNFGLSSLLVPRSGEPNFDSNEADPFENKKRRQEREVKGLLDKIRPDMIALDPDFVGSLAPPTRLTTAVHDKLDIPFARLPRLERLRVQGRADETELDADAGADAVATEDDGGKNKKSRAEREKRKMRGKGKSLKRYLRKQRKNVIDPTARSVLTGQDQNQSTDRRHVATLAIIRLGLYLRLRLYGFGWKFEMMGCDTLLVPYFLASAASVANSTKSLTTTSTSSLRLAPHAFSHLLRVFCRARYIDRLEPSLRRAIEVPLVRGDHGEAVRTLPKKGWGFLTRSRRSRKLPFDRQATVPSLPSSVSPGMVSWYAVTFGAHHSFIDTRATAARVRCVQGHPRESRDVHVRYEWCVRAWGRGGRTWRWAMSKLRLPSPPALTVTVRLEGKHGMPSGVQDDATEEGTLEVATLNLLPCARNIPSAIPAQTRQRPWSRYRNAQVGTLSIRGDRWDQYK
ncbi:hypothetical protein EV363DRAFT_1301879 [Boletus edulis]|nr:hypothetical protein EV363DRAFT_1301879 [Boletus edulis]